MNSSRFSSVIEFIKQNQRFIITAHESPDGDAIGSEIATMELLSALDKEVLIINADPDGGRYGFLDDGGDVNILTSTYELPTSLDEWVLLVLDTNDIHNIGSVADRILPKVSSVMIIDHHEEGVPGKSEGHVDMDASSTCELIFELYCEMEITISYRAALALYVGIVYDTGNFAYPKTCARTFAIAESLVNLGVSPNLVYINLYESNTISALKLQAMVLGSLRLLYQDRLAIQTMTKETLEECGAFYFEGDTLINTPLRSKSVVLSVLLKENPDRILRCSMRSKGNLNVAVVAQEFGGGGHKTAAGFKSPYSIEETTERVIARLWKLLEESE